MDGCPDGRRGVRVQGRWAASGASTRLNERLCRPGRNNQPCPPVAGSLHEPGGGEPVVDDVGAGEPEYDGADPADMPSEGAGPPDDAISEPGRGDGKNGDDDAHTYAERYEVPGSIGEPLELQRGTDHAEEHRQGASQRCQTIGQSVGRVPAQATAPGGSPKTLSRPRRQ